MGNSTLLYTRTLAAYLPSQRHQVVVLDCLDAYYKSPDSVESKCKSKSSNKQFAPLSTGNSYSGGRFVAALYAHARRLPALRAASNRLFHLPRFVPPARASANQGPENHDSHRKSSQQWAIRRCSTRARSRRLPSRSRRSRLTPRSLLCACTSRLLSRYFRRTNYEVRLCPWY